MAPTISVRAEEALTMGFEFKKAARTNRRVRLAADGPSGGGKTYSLLRLAFALKAANLATKIAVIDTENGGSEAYAGERPDGETWEFDVLQLNSFSPETYTQAIAAAVRAKYDCLVIDSLSHAWIGKDGALDIVDRSTGADKGFNAWKNVTPMHRQMLEAIIRCPAHVLASMRTKTEYVVEKDSKGRSVPRKVGLAPVQRDGVEYEFDLYGTLDHDHILRITKSRCPQMQDAFATKPGPDFWQPLIDWLKGAAPEQPAPAVQQPRPAQAPRPVPKPTTPEQVAAIAGQFDATVHPPQPVQFAADQPPARLNPEQESEIQSRLHGDWCSLQGFLDAFEIGDPAHLPADRYEEALELLKIVGDIEELACAKGVPLNEVLSKVGRPASLFMLDDAKLIGIRNGLAKAPPREIPA